MIEVCTSVFTCGDLVSTRPGTRQIRNKAGGGVEEMAGKRGLGSGGRSWKRSSADARCEGLLLR